LSFGCRRKVAKAGRLKRIYVASTLALSGLAFLSIFYTDSARTLGDFYAGCFLGMSSPERLPGCRQTVFGSVALTAALTLVRVILPDVGGSLGLAAFFAVALVVGLRRAMAPRKALVLRSRKTDPIRTAIPSPINNRWIGPRAKVPRYLPHGETNISTTICYSNNYR
jgi:hypothetical protein